MKEDSSHGTKRGASHDPPPNLPKVVEVTGAPVSWLNQRYTLVPSADVESNLGERAAKWSIGHRGAFIYCGESASPKGEGSCPYIWKDWSNRQWKLATIGFVSSHFVSRISSEGIFPQDLRAWMPGPAPVEDEPLFPKEIRHHTKSIRVKVPEDEVGIPRSLVATPSSNEILILKGIAEIPFLTSKLASDFFQQGYIIVKSAELKNLDLIKPALRASNIVIRNTIEHGSSKIDDHDPQLFVRDYRVKRADPVWQPISSVLRDCPLLCGLLAHFMDSEVQEPNVCQLAMIFPEGAPDDDYSKRQDSRPNLDYHIDGRGNIPNGFTLLVGVALNDQPQDCQSWGGLTVFPGSHRMSDLHKIYPSYKCGQLQQRMDLGQGHQIHLCKGDVVIAHSLLAHRSSENWSEVTRCMTYFRVRPAHAHRSQDWQDSLLQDPFANLAGVKRMAQ